MKQGGEEMQTTDVFPCQLPPWAATAQAHGGAIGKRVRHAPISSHRREKAAAEFVHQFPPVTG